MFELSVKEQNLYEYKRNDSIVSDSLNFVKVKFHFSKEWEGLNKTAQFKQNDKVINKDLKNDIADFPNEMKEGKFIISVFGKKGIVRATTNELIFEIIKSGYKDVAEDKEDQATQEQINSILQNMKSTINEDGHLVIDIPDDVDIDFYLDSEGNLIVEEDYSNIEFELNNNNLEVHY